MKAPLVTIDIILQTLPILFSSKIYFYCIDIVVLRKPFQYITIIIYLIILLCARSTMFFVVVHFFSNIIIMEMKCVFILFGYLDYAINVLKKK